MGRGCQTTTRTKVSHLLDCIDTHPDAKLRYHNRGIILHCDNDTSYLAEKKARNRVGGCYYLRSHINPTLDEEIYCEHSLIDVVMVSAAEYKVGALFYNARNMIPMKMTLQKLKYSQPPTPMKIDNMTARYY